MDYKILIDPVASLVGEELFSWLILILFILFIFILGANKIIDLLAKLRNEKKEKKISEILTNLEKLEGLDEEKHPSKKQTIIYLNNQLAEITATRKKRSPSNEIDSREDVIRGKVNFFGKIKLFSHEILIAAFLGSLSILWAHFPGYLFFHGFVLLIEKVIFSFEYNGIVEASPYAVSLVFL
ncbi:MAG: hypothetical protein D3909_18630 [Candidatus Electrothrix sp. ATG1]|nr:hypothetical protein [Candidatus Electrothrix sp. ATG1]